MTFRIKGISGITYFTHGKRGNLYTGICKGRKVVIKTKRPESEAVGRIENEIRFLKILNKKNIGPQLLLWDKKKFSYFVYRFIEGAFFPEFLDECSRKDKKKVLMAIAKIFSQCYALDRLGINKEEMSHPPKHIIIENRARKPILIDFERCHYTEKPGNVTQFCSYIISGFVKKKLNLIGIAFSRLNLIRAAQRYKMKNSRENLRKILHCFATHHPHHHHHHHHHPDFGV